jgi:hypothetical protein
MLERWATYDKRGSVTGYLLKDSAAGSSSPAQARHSSASDSPLVNTVCLIVGLIMLTALAVLFWLMVTSL